LAALRAVKRFLLHFCIGHGCLSFCLRRWRGGPLLGE
jgi:hypothetical protein